MTAKSTIPNQQSAPIPARVTAVEEIAADMRIYKLDTGGALHHRAGQYALIGAEGFEPREYSIASTPESGFAEFHVKATGKGGLSDHIFANWKVGSEVTLDAPHGEHYWRASERPLLALAGGVGIAPMKAIIEAHVAHAQHAPVHLYWGVKDQTHLYLDGFFHDLAARHKEFHYVPLVLENKHGAARRTGFIAPAIEQDFKELSNFNIYIAGPRPMVEATLPALLARGADRKWLFSDAFKLGF